MIYFGLFQITMLLGLNPYERCWQWGMCAAAHQISLILFGSAFLSIVLLVVLYFLCNKERRRCQHRSVESPSSLQPPPPSPMTNQQPTAPQAPADQMNLPTFTDVENQLAIIRAQQDLQMALIQQQQQVQVQSRTNNDDPTVLAEA